MINNCISIPKAYKYNQRNCIAKWKRLGRNSDNENVINIKNEIRKTVYNERKNKIQREIKPCSSKSLWNAVKIAKDQDTSQIPDELLEQYD